MSEHRWSTGLGFTLGAVGTAVGLGSIWRFPYLAGAGGGFAFIAVFVLACLIFGAPVLIGETLIGRWSRQSPPLAAGTIAARFGFSTRWNIVGWTGSLAGFLILTYYTMIAGWVMAYTWFFLGGSYATGGVAPVVQKFKEFVADSRAVSLWQLAFIALVTVISIRGVNRGVEWINRVRAPALLALLLVLAAYSLATGDVARGLHFAFAPDLSRLTPSVVLGAVGQALFALGISAGAIIAYGAYMATGESLRRNVFAVVGSIFRRIAPGDDNDLPAGVSLRAESGRRTGAGIPGAAGGVRPDAGRAMGGCPVFCIADPRGTHSFGGTARGTGRLAPGAHRHAAPGSRAARSGHLLAGRAGLRAVLQSLGQLASAGLRATARTARFLWRH